jgi:hypothetical protein
METKRQKVAEVHNSSEQAELNSKLAERYKEWLVPAQKRRSSVACGKRCPNCNDLQGPNCARHGIPFTDYTCLICAQDLGRRLTRDADAEEYVKKVFCAHHIKCIRGIDDPTADAVFALRSTEYHCQQIKVGVDADLRIHYLGANSVSPAMVKSFEAQRQSPANDPVTHGYVNDKGKAIWPKCFRNAKDTENILERPYLPLEMPLDQKREFAKHVVDAVDKANEAICKGEFPKTLYDVSKLLKTMTRFPSPFPPYIYWGGFEVRFKAEKIINGAICLLARSHSLHNLINRSVDSMIEHFERTGKEIIFPNCRSWINKHSTIMPTSYQFIDGCCKGDVVEDMKLYTGQFIYHVRQIIETTLQQAAPDIVSRLCICDKTKSDRKGLCDRFSQEDKNIAKEKIDTELVRNPNTLLVFWGMKALSGLRTLHFNDILTLNVMMIPHPNTLMCKSHRMNMTLCFKAFGFELDCRQIMKRIPTLYRGATANYTNSLQGDDIEQFEDENIDHSEEDSESE